MPELEFLEENMQKTTLDKVKEMIKCDSVLSAQNIEKLDLTILNSTYSNRQYVSLLFPDYREVPTISLAPALILRKKNSRGANKCHTRYFIYRGQSHRMRDSL